jgi:hypothetical protein
MNDMLLSLKCYWYVQAEKSIEPTGNVNDSKCQRPDCVHT